MYYATGTNIKGNFYGRSRKLDRTDGFFPTNTMLLHQRIIGWHRKRRIPVKDADTGSTLNAFLIDPKYLENGQAIMPNELPDPKPSTHIPVYQYSRITRDTPKFQAITAQLSTKLSAVLNMMKVGFVALLAEVTAKSTAIFHPKPATHYAVRSGASIDWKQRIKLFTATLLMGGLLVAAVAFNGNDVAKPMPVSANPGGTDTSHTSSPSHNSMSSITSDETESTTSPATSQSHAALNTSSKQATTYQQAISNTLSGAATSVNPATTTAPVSTTATTAASSPSANTAPTSNPQTPTPLDPVLTPVTGLVNNISSTQVNVNNPLPGTTTTPLVQINQ